MSSSEEHNPRRWGRVFMGPDVARESTIDKILNDQQRDLWNRSTEIEYLKRVRDKATAEAQALLEKAQERAASQRTAVEAWAEGVKQRMQALHAEALQERDLARQERQAAEQLRAGAREEGFRAGMAEAESMIASHERGRDAAAAAILRRVQEQCGVLFEAWRQELTAVAREAVEMAAGWIIREEQAAILEHLLTESARAMENRLAVQARVHPDEAELARDILGRVQDQLGIERWKVQADPQVEPGGLILENEAGRVDNLPSMRRAVVEEVMTRLGLPVTERDEAAMAAVRATTPELDALPVEPPPAPVPSDALPEPRPELETPAATLSASPAEEAFEGVSAELSLEDLQEDPQAGPDAGVADERLDAPAAESADAADPATLFASPPPPEEAEAALADAISEDPEHKSMEMAEAAMDKALTDAEPLPDDVAAYIMEAVTPEAASEPQPGLQPEPEPADQPDDAAAVPEQAADPEGAQPGFDPDGAPETDLAPADEPASASEGAEASNAGEADGSTAPAASVADAAAPEKAPKAGSKKTRKAAPEPPSPGSDTGLGTGLGGGLGGLAGLQEIKF